MIENVAPNESAFSQAADQDTCRLIVKFVLKV